MSGKVVSLNGQHFIGGGERSEVCVAAMRDLLEKAESGELQGFTCSYLWRDGTASYHIAGQVGGFGMVGALEAAKAELVAVNLGEYE